MNAYFQMSTANPTGQRPWDFVNQGTGPNLGRLHGRGMGRIGRLGVNMPFASQFQPQLDSLAAQLAQIQSDINATNQMILQGNAAGIDMSQEAQNNNLAQQNQVTAVNDLNIIYRALFGTVAPGLSGFGRLGRFGGLGRFGQFDPATLATAAGVAAAIAIVAGIVAVAYQYGSAAKASAQTKLTTAQTQQSSVTQQNTLLNQAAAAYASGNTQQGDLLNSLAAQAGASAAGASGTPSSSPTDWNTWLQQNAVMIGIAAIAIFVGPTLVKKIL